jgi:hypothetical protein
MIVLLRDATGRIVTCDLRVVLEAVRPCAGSGRVASKVDDSGRLELLPE